MASCDWLACGLVVVLLLYSGVLMKEVVFETGPQDDII